MRKYILTIFLSFVCYATLFASTNKEDDIYRKGFAANIGVSSAFEPHNRLNYIAFPNTVNMGIGYKWFNFERSILYCGLGLSPGVYSTCINESGLTSMVFIMPFYAQFSFIHPHQNFIDIKCGGEYYSFNGVRKVLFYIQITPLGYSFDKKNTIGIGWRYHTAGSHESDFQGHGVVLSYQHTF